MPVSRRKFLGQAGAIGCTTAASPFITPVVFASAPTDTRLVVIILRGAMDGLDVVQPYGDPNLSAWRNSLSVGPEAGAHDLDGFYALHPKLAGLMLDGSGCDWCQVMRPIPVGRRMRVWNCPHKGSCYSKRSTAMIRFFMTRPKERWNCQAGVALCLRPKRVVQRPLRSLPQNA